MLALSIFPEGKETFAEVLNKKKSFADVFVEEATKYSAEDALLAFELKDILFEKLKEAGLEGVYFDIEAPLIPVLSDMEEAGVKIDVDKLNDISKELARELDSHREGFFSFQARSSI